VPPRLFVTYSFCVKRLLLRNRGRRCFGSPDHFTLIYVTLSDLEFGSALKRLRLLSEGVDEAVLHVSHWQLRVDGSRTVRNRMACGARMERRKNHAGSDSRGARGKSLIVCRKSAGSPTVFKSLRNCLK
jgi:hypothetical protein